MINEPLTPEQRQTMSFMRNLAALPPDEQRQVYGKVYAFMRNMAALALDEQPPELKVLVKEARHLLRPPD